MSARVCFIESAELHETTHPLFWIHVNDDDKIHIPVEPIINQQRHVIDRKINALFARGGELSLGLFLDTRVCNRIQELGVLLIHERTAG